MYLKEFSKNRFSILIIIALVIISYAVFLCNERTVVNLTSEDHLFEGGTSLFLLSASILFLISAKRNIFMYLLAVLFLFGAGEEISWGQRILGFEPPAAIKEVNVQSEFNIHNLPVFNGTKHKGEHIKKEGWARLLEINFLYRLFLLAFGIALPLLAYHVSFIKKIVKQLKVPVPPFSMGIFLVLSWVVCKLVIKALPPGLDKNYYFGANEIWEFLTAFIIFNFGIYFYKNRDKEIFGMDIKETTLL